MRSITATALLFTTIPFTTLAATRKPACTVRFHMEVRASASDPFSVPVKLQSPPRTAFMESTASISERQVTSIFTYPAADGSWGCLFQLDDSGRITLANISSSNRGRSLIFFLGNDKLSRQVIDIQIDDPVSDGLLPVPRGLTYGEIELLKKKFPVVLTPRGRS